MTALYIIGLLIGVLSLTGGSSSLHEATKQTLDAYLTARTGKGFFSILLSSLIYQVPFVLIAFLCGTSLVGVALVPLIICYKGFTIGLLSAMLYATYSLKGITFMVLLVIPYTIVSVIALLLAARESIGFSLLLVRLSMPKGTATSIYNDFKNYCARYLFLLIVLLAAAIVDAILSLAFMRFFAF